MESLIATNLKNLAAADAAHAAQESRHVRACPVSAVDACAHPQPPRVRRPRRRGAICPRRLHTRGLVFRARGGPRGAHAAQVGQPQHAVRLDHRVFRGGMCGHEPGYRQWLRTRRVRVRLAEQHRADLRLHAGRRRTEPDGTAAVAPCAHARVSHVVRVGRARLPASAPRQHRALVPARGSRRLPDGSHGKDRVRPPGAIRRAAGRGGNAPQHVSAAFGKAVSGACCSSHSRSATACDLETPTARPRHMPSRLRSSCSCTWGCSC